MAQFPEEHSQTGTFERQEDHFRGYVDTVERNRYHLYVCKACPWAHRAWIVLRLMGLEKGIGVSFADPVRDEKGWAFRAGEGHGSDAAEGFQFLSEAYRLSDPSFKGRVTVPVLWDKQEKCIINNSEDDICKMFNHTFRSLAENKVDLFPQELADEQSSLSNYIYETINNGVYRAGFASKQNAYESAVTALFQGLEQMEKRLTHGGPYLFGDRIVESDWRLFCTLVRFDAVYYSHFKCNLKRIKDFVHLQAYLERLYLQPGVTATVNMDHIKRHYYGTHDELNPSGIIPKGPQLDWLQQN